MYYFYSRVSTVGQNASRQAETFKTYPNFTSDNLYVDKIQGNVPFLQRPEASKLFDAVTSEGGYPTIVVDSVSRLGRDLIDILQTIELFNRNGINLKSVKEGFETLIDGKVNPVARIVVATMGSIAEMNRLRIKERAAEGIQLAKASGKYKGRKLGSTQSDDRLLERHPIIAKKLKKGLTVREIASIVDCSTTTVVKVRKVLAKRGELLVE